MSTKERATHARPHSAAACVPHAAHEREASLLLEEEEERRMDRIVSLWDKKRPPIPSIVMSFKGR